LLLFKIEELHKKKILYEELMIERKKSISDRYINENKSELSKIVLKVHELFRELVPFQIKKQNFHFFLNKIGRNLKY